MKLMEYLLVTATGGIVYCFIECLWRGYTHPSMAVCGALCFFLIYVTNKKLSSVKWWTRSLIGAMIITAVEFLVGCVVNIALGLCVWDYSNLYLNILGQVSLLYSALWFLLCIPAYHLCAFMRKKIFYN